MSLSEELPLLKARAQAIGARLDLLSRQISEIQQGAGSPLSIAVIDSEKCLGCGLCEAACPVGAIAIKNTALVNAARCIGCGRCIVECRQGAIVMRLESHIHRIEFNRRVAISVSKRKKERQNKCLFGPGF